MQALSSPVSFFVFPDALHPSGGRMPPGPWKSIVYLMHILTNGKTSTPWKSMRSLRYSGKLLLEKYRLFRCRVQGQPSLVRGMGLNKPHTFPKCHWHIIFFRTPLDK